MLVICKQTIPKHVWKHFGQTDDLNSGFQRAGYPLPVEICYQYHESRRVRLDCWIVPILACTGTRPKSRQKKNNNKKSKCNNLVDNKKRQETRRREGKVEKKNSDTVVRDGGFSLIHFAR